MTCSVRVIGNRVPGLPSTQLPTNRSKSILLLTLGDVIISINANNSHMHGLARDPFYRCRATFRMHYVNVETQHLKKSWRTQQQQQSKRTQQPKEWPYCNQASNGCRAKQGKGTNRPLIRHTEYVTSLLHSSVPCHGHRGTHMVALRYSNERTKASPA